MIARSSTLLVTLSAVAAILASRPQEIPHYVWNLTPSIPRGFYRLDAHAPLRVTTLVAVRLPEPLATILDLNGYLPLGVPLLKRVLAMPGQRVCRSGAVITVDGMPVEVVARERDSRGRLLPSWQGCFDIAADEIFLMNWDSGDSFDGRYLGALPRSSIIAAAIPVWTDEAGDGEFVWFAPTE
ncbi:S26 family signal peptidase [Pseudorhodoplanes sp.]|uniref:S26 family signal peptidase n=1 Tax=Pseudorhodoplanes sp. TaxID=1934341 RepID=UPI002C59EC27|nr:S26 family signal peptidase [Pseudorhodoplanes sp.]HWV51707.1 S26 family signal peptidase [Pseudorhodoplanes sp.]